jgi:hypothetical protein
MSHRVIANALAAGTALTNTASEGALYAHSFAAGFWRPGKSVRGSFGAITSASNSTDTLGLLFRFGATATGGTAIATSALVDQADGDVGGGDCVITCRSVDADGVGVFVAQASLAEPDATGTITRKQFGPVVISAINTLAATALGFNGKWSVANAGNIAACQLALIEEIA